MCQVDLVLVQNQRMTDSTVIDGNPQVFINEKKCKHSIREGLEEVIQVIACGLVKGIYATFWTV
jgi:hypothetical protein